MAVADDEGPDPDDGDDAPRRDRPSADPRETGQHTIRPNIDRIADKVKRLLRDDG